MSVIKDIWSFLVQRKLWPVALLLVAAAVAVPKLLAQEPAAPVADPVVAVKGDKSAVLATEPIVAKASDDDRSGRRQVLGSRKDPFKPQVTPTPIPKLKVVAPVDPAKTPADPGGGTTVGGSPAPTTGTPVAPTPVKPKKKYQLNELTVRFGPSGDTRPPRRDVKRLQALPSSEEPVLIYLGVLKDKKTVVFLVDSGVIAEGDGTCMPRRTSCQTIHLKEGETEFFDVADPEGEDGAEGEAAPDGEAVGAQYQLDVLKIRKTVTTSAKKAAKRAARVSKSGQKILRARVAGDGPLRYHYNKRSGRLEKLSHKAYKAVIAKAAKTARAHF